MTSWPRLRKRSDIRCKAFQPPAIEASFVGVDEQRGPYFDDDSLGLGQAASGGFAVSNIHLYTILPFT